MRRFKENYEKKELDRKGRDSYREIVREDVRKKKEKEELERKPNKTKRVPPPSRSKDGCEDELVLLLSALESCWEVGVGFSTLGVSPGDEHRGIAGRLRVDDRLSFLDQGDLEGRKVMERIKSQHLLQKGRKKTK